MAGYEAEGGNRVARVLDVAANLDQVELWSIALGLMTLVMALLLPLSKLGKAGRPVAILIPSVLLAVLGLGSVEVVSDVGDIPRGLPLPSIPSLAGLLDVTTGAFAVALVILVQGAGISQSITNPEGQRNRVSRDFVAQGAANVASGQEVHRQLKDMQKLDLSGRVRVFEAGSIRGDSTRSAVRAAEKWLAAQIDRG